MTRTQLEKLRLGGAAAQEMLRGVDTGSLGKREGEGKAWKEACGKAAEVLRTGSRLQESC